MSPVIYPCGDHEWHLDIKVCLSRKVWTEDIYMGIDSMVDGI